MTAMAREQPEEFYRIAVQKGEADAEKFYNTEEKQRKEKDRIKTLDNIIRCLYEDRGVDGSRWNDMMNRRAAMNKSQQN